MEDKKKMGRYQRIYDQLAELLKKRMNPLPGWPLFVQCWAAFNRAEPIVVQDVHTFPEHISCDSRSRSEITVPVFDERGEIVAVFDVDSEQVNSFNEVDRYHLQRIMELIYIQ